MNRKEKLIKNLKDRLHYRKIEIENIWDKGRFIVLDVSDIIEARSTIVDMLGIEKVGVAQKTQNEFSKVANIIVSIGKKIVMPEEKFFIKVEINMNKSEKRKELGYVARDLQFASSGQLAVELSDTGARPAKSEYQSDRIIQSYIDHQYAYVCIHVTPAFGGLPFSSQNYKVLSSVHSSISALSCMMALKCGFLPEIFIPYTSEDDLREKIKLSMPILNRMDIKKYKVRLAFVNISGKFSESLELIVQESVSTRILSLLPGRLLIVPLSTVIHPLWYIDTTLKEIVCAGKMPLTPLILTSNINNNSYPLPGISEWSDDRIVGKSVRTICSSVDSSLIQKISFGKKEYNKIKKTITTLSNAALVNMKAVSFKVGPNYIHNIIDSI
jgi:hypothetical protein